MDTRLVLVLCFGLGVAVQSVLQVRGALSWGRVGISVLIALMSLIPFKGELAYQPWPHVFAALCVYAVVFAFAHRREILPRIGERTLLSLSMVFWFAVFVRGVPETPPAPLILGLLVIPSLAVLVIAFVPIRLGFVWKLMLYAWFLFVVVALAWMQFPTRQLQIFLDQEHLPWLTWIEAITGGMAFLYLAVNAVYLYLLVPLPSRGQSFKNRMKDWQELTGLMTRRVDDDQPGYVETFAILVGQGSVLLLVYYTNLVPPGLVINGFIVLPFLVALARDPDQFWVKPEPEPIPGKLAKPGRNARCPCGSGRKFKRCCGAPGAAQG